MKKIVSLLMLSTSFVLYLSCNHIQGNKTNNNLPDTLRADDNDEEDNGVRRRQSIDLFSIIPVDDNSQLAFISFSDIYAVGSDTADTRSIPNIRDKGLKAAQYFRLEGKYRERFLSKTNISETDSIFVYDYSINKLVAFAVNDQPLAAMINIYADESDFPYSPGDYMIGFEINQQRLKGFRKYYPDVLVAVGKESPFTRNPITPIVWKKISSDRFPKAEIQDDFYKQILDNAHPSTTYFFEKDSLRYFLRDYLDSDDALSARQLLVTHSKTNVIIIQKVFYQHESASLCDLNNNSQVNQWTGKLFKNKPPVIFGFEYVSFGCESISLIDPSNEDIYINCDNRH